MASMVYKWLHARMVLGIALALHLLKRPFRAASGQGARWLRAMRTEGLGATDGGHWRRVEAASRCIGCGRCNVLATDALPHPAATMAGAARLQADATELHALGTELRRIDGALARLCPTEASAAAVADVLDGHARSLRRLTEG